LNVRLKLRQPAKRGPYKRAGIRLIMLEKTKQWAGAIKRDVVALWLAARDPRVPWYAKALAGAVAAYALSPIDLIPDFVPVLGYLDDLVVVPLGIVLAVKLVPPELMAEFREEAAQRDKPVSRAGLAFIVVIWVLLAAVLTWLFWPS
jgi:uncharacterized membrane protein YkvA (DUF1232 family)